MAAGLADGVPARGDPARRTTSSSTRSSTSRSSCCAPTTWACARSRTRAAIAACKVVEGRGTCESGFTCPFHGWCYGARRHEHRTSRGARRSPSTTCSPDDIDLVPVRCEVWGGCAWINLDDDAPPLRQCIEPVATILDAWKVESLRTEWWYACRLPVNWKLAEEAFVEQYHVVETHPAARHPRRGTRRAAGARSTRARSSTRRSTTCAR